MPAPSPRGPLVLEVELEVEGLTSSGGLVLRVLIRMRLSMVGGRMGMGTGGRMMGLAVLHLAVLNLLVLMGLMGLGRATFAPACLAPGTGLMGLFVARASLQVLILLSLRWTRSRGWT